VGFKDEQLRNAFKAYATYVAKNYKPEYMALGVEVNMMYERSPEQFAAFVKLYEETYDLVKATSPQTKVFPTFQLEDMEGTFGTPHPPQWEVLDEFSGRMDALALSTYPFLAGIRSTADIRPEAYAQIRGRWSGEIIIAETGHPSASVEGEVVTGTEEDQREYVKRLLTEAEKHGFSMVVWLAALDPAFPSGGSGAVFRNIGLRQANGANKLAWGAWEEWARRPLKR
jgi:arabinogalactan endo-1,4-beta-galactosidase